MILEGLGSTRAMYVDGILLNKVPLDWGNNSESRKTTKLAELILKKVNANLSYLDAFKKHILYNLPPNTFKAKIAIEKWLIDAGNNKLQSHQNYIELLDVDFFMEIPAHTGKTIR